MPQADPKSSSAQEQQQTAPSPYPQHLEDDTIDLYDLWIAIWKKKWLVVAFTIVSALGSIVYALQLPSLYKAEAVLLPPEAKDIQSMNILGIEFLVDTANDTVTNSVLISSNEVFKKFKQSVDIGVTHSFNLQLPLLPSKQ